MTLTITIIIVTLSSIGVGAAFLIMFIQKLKKLENHARHYQWLWNNGLQESACIVNPDLASWMGV